MSAITTTNTVLSPATPTTPTPKARANKNKNKQKYISESNAKVQETASNVDKIRTPSLDPSVHETKSSECSPKLSDLHDVQHPTRKDLEDHLAKIKSQTDIFSELNTKIDALRNEAQICKNALDAKSSANDYEEKLTGFQNRFSLLKEQYNDQWEPIEKINKNLTKLIADARHQPLTEDAKKTFSALTNYSLTQINADEEAFNKVVTTCVATSKDIAAMYENTVRRFENARGHINDIDNYIHTTDENPGFFTTALNAAKYYAGRGKKVTLTFDPKQKKPAEDKTQPVPATLAEKVNVAEVVKEETKTAEASQEESQT